MIRFANLSLKRIYNKFHQILKIAGRLLRPKSRKAINKSTRTGIRERQLISEDIVASTPFGIAIAITAGLVSYFDDELAAAVRSVDLSGTPLSPLSIVQDVILQLLQGIKQSVQNTNFVSISMNLMYDIKEIFKI